MRYVLVPQAEYGKETNEDEMVLYELPLNIMIKVPNDIVERMYYHNDNDCLEYYLKKQAEEMILQRVMPNLKFEMVDFGTYATKLSFVSNDIKRKEGGKSETM